LKNFEIKNFYYFFQNYLVKCLQISQEKSGKYK